MRGIAPGGDGAVECLLRLRVLLFVPIQLAEFLEIRRRRIVDNGRFHRVDARLAAVSPVHVPQHTGIRQYLRHDVYQGAQKSPEENDPQPESLRPAAHKMHQRDQLHDESPGIKKITQAEDSRHYALSPRSFPSRTTLTAGWQRHCR